MGRRHRKGKRLLAPETEPGSEWIQGERAELHVPDEARGPLAAEWRDTDVWVHGDITGSNLLMNDDRLCGVIDFGCSAVGDPACDLTAAWTMFDGTSRARFMAAVPLDHGTWARARGWAIVISQG